MTDSAVPTPPAPLAIVGLSCLFPQAGSVTEFWSNIRRGVDAITEVPATHWRPDDYFDRDPKSPDMTYARRGGFLSPIPFDPLEFGIAPSNLEAIDTSQLLGLVAAKRALEDAGYGANGKACDRSRIGCILGVTGTLEMVIPLGARLGHPKWREALRAAGVDDDVAEEVIARIGESYVPWQENSFPGLLGNVVAGRIANRLDLGGTNCVVDAACASSLSALHLAALELWSGRSDMVLTGGVDTFNDIFMYMCFSKTPALSPTGDARPFADNADGTILGEGVGIFALKRLADAERDGDHVYAVLRGIGTSSDGAGNAVYAPKKEGQIRCLENAYEVAGVDPGTIELVEAHGTGTKVGDATEVAALNEVYRRSSRPGPWCALGSVKSQIGHTKAAAGAAGLLKAILALTHRVLPPTAKVQQPQDVLLAEDAPLYVNVQARPWLASTDHPRRAAVSAFGFGGSNFHAVLEEAPSARPEIDWDGDVVIAAWSAGSLDELKSRLRTWPATTSWAAVRVAAARARQAFQSTAEHRLVCVWERDKTDVAAALRQLGELLDKYADRSTWSTPDGAAYSRGARLGQLAVLFPGQGSQSVGMLRELACRFPRMQEVLAEADAAFLGQADGPGVRLSRYIYPPPAWSTETKERQDRALRATDIAQPAIGAVSLGALAVLQQFGVTAELTAGHSYGELTALCASKRYEPAALYRLSTLRGRLMAASQEVDGGMLAVGASLSQVEAAIAEAAVDLVIANRNGPNQVVLSGRLPDIDRAAELFSRKNLRGKKLPVAAAFHSPLVAAASAKFRPVLEEIEFAPAEVPVYANSSAECYPNDPAAARELLAGQLAKPVEFVRQIENMYAAGARTFVEVGPGSVLTGLVGSILAGKEFRAVAIDATAGQRPGLWDLAMVLAQVAVAGHAVDLSRWDPNPPELPPTTDRLTIPLSGANYVKPRTPRPPRPRAAAAPTAATPKPTTPPPAAHLVAAPPATSPPDKNPLLPSPMPTATSSASMVRPAVELMVERRAPALPQTDTIPASLAVLQKMQEETARLHRQFLEGQETALRTLAGMITGGAVGPTTSPSVTPWSPPSTALPHPPAANGHAPAPAPLPPRQAPAPRPILSAATVAPAVTSQPAAVATPAAQNDGSSTASLTPQVLAVVSEKTGYPVEMLKPAMSLDHDLGIDSIKRVEILSALQERLPQLPTVTPEQLQTLHRLQDVIELLGTTGPESAVPVPSKTPASSSPAIDLTPQVMAVVAEKTGYPVEMLKPAMSLDHDLGIDSIKRVEILSALQERLPQLPTVTPEQLQTLHRLQDVIELLGSTSSVVTTPIGTATLVPRTSQVDLTPQVMAVVAEKTGYPVEMLKPAMSLDHDLGIDSIKRVEILSALQERLPQLPNVTPEQLQTLHRLQDVINLLGATNPVGSTPAQPTPAVGVRAADLTPQVLAVVAEKTGYPVEMLKPAMSLDHDLGIDSIKRVEILSALQERLPHLPSVTPEQLQTLHRLEDVIALLGGSHSDTGPRANTAAIAPANAATPDHVVPQPIAAAASAMLETGAVVARFLPEGARTPLTFPAGGEFWITEDGSELTLALAAKFTAAGYRARLVSWDAPTVPSSPQPIAGLILIAPRSGTSDAHLWRALEWTQKVGPALRQTARHGATALFATVARLDGQFGLAGTGELSDVASGGFAGLTKTVRHEWTELTCKGLDLGADLNAESAVELLFRELTSAGPIECGLSSQGRCEPQVEPVGARDTTSVDSLPLNPGDLVLVTGGARGVTAAAAQAVAVRYRPTMVLVGRNAPPQPEPDYLRGVVEPTLLKQALAVHGAAATPRALQQLCQQILAQREITATLASLRGLGVTAEYHSVDVRDISAVCRLIEDLQRRHGPLRGLIHGAGVLADHRIEDKTRDQFDGVFTTKVTGLRNILGAVRPEALRTLLLFSSFTARYGRTGQVDYAMANEVLNKLGQQWRRRQPDCRVVAFNWGPWDGGMVQGGLKGLFAKEGVGLIPLDAGAGLVAEQMTLPATSPVELVVLGPGSTTLGSLAAQTPVVTSPVVEAPAEAAAWLPADARLAFSRVLSVATAPYLKSHVLAGKGVLPVAVIVEYLAHGVLHRNPGLDFQGVDGLKVLKGVKLELDGAVPLEVHVGKPRRSNGHFVVAAYLSSRDGDRHQLHASADIVLGTGYPEEPGTSYDVGSREAREIAEPYRLLFHGPLFHGIERVARCTADGLRLEARTATPPADWVTEPWRTQWLADPLAIDVALQGLIVWCRTYRDIPCLPTGMGRYRQYRRSFPKGGVTVTIALRAVSEHRMLADVTWHDSAGRLIATLEQADNVLDPALVKAFASP